MTIQKYIDNLNKRFQTGISREHAYRGDLQLLLETILKDVQVINEPARITCGAPDYILMKKDIPVGYIEAKDIAVDLNSKSLKEQFDRYKASLTNLIFTDYMDFHFYRDGQFVNSIRIAEIVNGSIVGHSDQFDHFEQLIKDFAQMISQAIKSPSKLAEMMAGKARLLANIIEQAVLSDEVNEANSQLKDQYKAFQNVLLHDITPKAFADMYAQTIAYGMFAARYHDPTIPTFSREEAATLIPHSNPFLRKLFQSIAGYDLDSRIAWIVDDLVQIFLASDVAVIMRNFGKSTKQEDPIIHFYETFLAAYDPSLRKSRGVWYTPEPVVNFIVRAVDDILKTEFNLPQGLADTSKTKIKVDYQGKKIEKEVHRVQVLDPATGTGTFLAEVIKLVHGKFKGMQGMWPKYVENDLIPRLNGFELLMTSYAMAHLKMDILLTETGFTNPNNKRFKIFLTNSLEEAHENQFNLFTQWLSQEANEANAIKKDTPVMCVIGNPPYSVSSNNKSPWIEKLTADYKNDLNERNIQPLSDDYIKFIRFGQHFIDTNGEGLLAYISNNSFIDGIIHRQMRKNLLETFDKIFILDLHGNSKKQEVCKDGSPDQNVFDIMQGVSINIFVKSQKKNKNELGKVFHFDLQGKRNDKYSFLNDNNLNSISWDNILFKAPEFLFSKMDFELKTKYDFGFSLNKLFPLNNVGFTAARDNSLIHFEKGKVEELLTDLTSMELENIRIKHQFGPDSRDWTLQGAINDIKAKTERNISILNYRPFDFRYSHLSNQTKGFFSYPRWEIMRNFYKKENIGLIATRLNRQKSTGYFWISKSIIERHILDTAGDSTSFFPLYIYPEFNGQQTTDQTIVRVPNLNMEFVSKISKSLELTFTNEKEDNSKSFAPLDLLDYIYAVLYSPSYREKYKEFLKIDFPKVPYATDADKFWKLVVLGKELREIHLLESPKVEEYITGYPEEGDNIVGKPTYKDGSVYINETQYFSNVKEVAWNFYIGGYQPAQKWLKDRKDRELSYDDILHYQKIIVALTETDRIMKEIDEVGVE
ncbi:MAG: type ISP restriction/modification enzyme [Saprospiraceae bacterium]